MIARFAILASLLAIAVGCQKPQAPTSWKIEGRTMGTTFSITIADPKNALSENPPDVDSISAEIAHALEDIARQMSTYRPDSEIASFNASSPGETVAISPGFAIVVQKASELHQITNGKYDVTVAPLVELWGFGPAQPRTTPPTDDEIATALANVGMQHVELSRVPPALKKSKPGIRLDLNSIAPGYAVDLLCEILQQHGLCNYLVDIGGEFRAKGRNPAGADWRVAIEKPVPGANPGQAIQSVIELRDQALATSGDYRAYFESGGIKYSHTIDPTTGRPVEHNLASATVIAPDAMTADALATAVMVLGSEEGAELIRRSEGTQAFLILRANGGFQERHVNADSINSNSDAGDDTTR